MITIDEDVGSCRCRERACRASSRAWRERGPDDAADDVVAHERAVVHGAAPATIGAKVRTIGTKRARMIALEPWRSKNSSAWRGAPA